MRQLLGARVSRSRRGEPAAAVTSLREAVRRWHALGAPYEAARARTLLAEAYQATKEDESAAVELEAATVDLRATRSRRRNPAHRLAPTGGPRRGRVRTFSSVTSAGRRVSSRRSATRPGSTSSSGTIGRFVPSSASIEETRSTTQATASLSPSMTLPQPLRAPWRSSERSPSIDVTTASRHRFASASMQPTRSLRGAVSVAREFTLPRASEPSPKRTRSLQAGRRQRRHEWPSRILVSSSSRGSPNPSRSSASTGRRLAKRHARTLGQVSLMHLGGHRRGRRGLLSCSRWRTMRSTYVSSPRTTSRTWSRSLCERGNPSSPRFGSSR